MTKDDYEEFAAALVLVSEMLGKPAPDDSKINMQFVFLQEYHIDEIILAIKDYVLYGDRGGFVPAPSDIVRQIQRRKKEDPSQQIMTPEQAWSKALQVRDESNTVYINDLVMQAYSTVAHMVEDDIVGAKVSFMQTYDFLEKKAKAEGTTYPMRFSYGSCQKKREAAIENESRLNFRLPKTAQITSIREELLAISDRADTLQESDFSNISHRNKVKSIFSAQQERTKDMSFADHWKTHQGLVSRPKMQTINRITPPSEALENIKILGEMIKQFQTGYISAKEKNKEPI